MKRIKYLKSIDRYLDEDVFFNIIYEHGYSSPIRRFRKSGHIEISRKICDLMTFSNEEIEEMQKYCEENSYLRREIRKSDNVNMILLWAKKSFFESSMEDNPYLYQTTPAHITYTITSPDGSLLIAGDFPSDLLSRKFGNRYIPYLNELKSVLLNSGWFEELKEKTKNRISRDYFYEKIDNNRIKLVDMSDNELVDISFVRYKDRQQLFRIYQDDVKDEEYIFCIRLEQDRESFEYTCSITTQEEFKKTLENVAESLDPYEVFDSYEDDIEDILEQI